MKKQTGITGNKSYLLLVIILYRLLKVQADPCSGCTSNGLEKDSKIITFGPSDEYNCNCEWTIETNVVTDDDTAVVLLLQDVSLPMESTTSSSSHCSGQLKLPGAGEFKCNFANNHCLAFVVEPNICTFGKIKDKLSKFGPNCTSNFLWNKAGGSPYKISYSAGNSAGYIKYFVIRYIEIDCTIQTTTFEPTTNLPPSKRVTEHHEDESTTNYVASSFITQKEPTSTNEGKSSNHSVTTNKTHKDSDASKTSMNSTMIIIIAASGAGLLLVILFAVLLATRFCKTKTTSPKYSKKNEEETCPNQAHEMIENYIYGETINDHKPETIINEIYDTTPVTEVTNDEPCLYAVVGKKTGNKKQDGDKNVGTEENIVKIEEEPSRVYAVVNKKKK